MFGYQPGHHHVVVDVDLAVDEEAFARNLDVVEDDERVLLVETARQRMVVSIGPARDAVAAEELQARRRHRDRERQRVARAVGGNRVRRIDRELVRERGQRGQHSRAAHDDAVPGVLDLVERDVAAAGRDVGRRLVDGRVDDRVRQREIAPAQLLLKRDQVCRALFVSGDRPLVFAPGEAGEGDVEIVGRAAHQADRVLCDTLQAAVAALEVGPGARDHVARR